MSNVLTDEARYKAGKSQMGTFLSNQYLMWRIVSVKSIRKIILTADEFYTDILPEEITQDEDVVNNEIRNGWLYEAMAQSEQAIEDLFSLLKNSTDIAYFAKNVVNYRATEVKNYIWNFKYDDIEYFMEQFKLPFFDLDDAEAWGEHQDVFEEYKKSVLLMQDYLKRLIQYHKHYYLDYCQYKHGMAVALKPFGKAHTAEEKRENLLEGALMTFDNYSIGKRMKNGTPPLLAFTLTPEVQPFLRSLHDEQNLLHYTTHLINVDEVVKITEMAYTLESVVWENLLKRSNITDEDTIHEWAFPLENYRRHIVIGFPVE